MGNSSSSFGAIIIYLDKSYFYVGEIVSGSICINLVKPNYPGNKLFLSLSGTEECIWWEHRNNFYRPSKTEYRPVLFTNRNSAERTILNQVILVKQFNDNQLNIGQLQIPFKLQLPKDIPGTYLYDGWGYDGIIKYNLKAHISKHSNQTFDILQDQIDLNIRELINPGKEISRYQENKTLIYNCCCCCSKGQTIVYGSLDKQNFDVGETATVKIQVDNSKSQSDISRIEVIFEMIVILNSDSGKRRLITKSINKEQVPGIKRGEVITQMNQRLVNIPLQNILQNKQDLPASVNGKYIQTSYNITVKCKMNLCCQCYCQRSPFVDLPINLNALSSENKYRIQAPEDWNPNVSQEQLLDLDIKQNQIKPLE